MASNTTEILSAWLLQKEPGMHCRKHSTILGMLAVYNIVSIIIAYILSTSLLYTQGENAKSVSISAFNWAGRFFLRRPKASIEISPPKTNNSHEETSVRALVASAVGSILIAVSAPIFAGISIRAKHQKDVTLWHLIAQWSTRPRASSLVFLVNSSSGNNRSKSGSRHAPHGFYASSFSAVLSELFVSFVGLGILLDPAFTPREQWDPEHMASDSSSMDYSVGLLMGVNWFCVLAVIILGILLPCVHSTPARLELGFKQAMGLARGLAVLSFLAYICSWWLWASFMLTTTEDLYCIEASTYIDAVYCMLPVALGLWRLGWAIK